MRKAWLSAFFLLIAAALAYPQQVSYKLMGGLTWFNGDDYNRGILNENKYLKDTTQTMSGAYQELKSGQNLQAEILVFANRHIAVGFGGGYYHSSRESTVQTSGLQGGLPFDSVSTFRPNLSVIPLFVNIHYMTRLASRLNLDIFAGPLYQVVQFKFKGALTTSLDAVNQIETFTASVTSFGAQGGLGLSFEIFRGVALVAEGCYRYGITTHLFGNWSLLGSSASGPISQSSSEYYMWSYDDTPAATYSRIGFFDKNGPTGNFVSNAEKSDLHLSGITALAGLKFSI